MSTIFMNDRNRLLARITLCLVVLSSAGAARADDEDLLRTMRAQRRAAMRDLNRSPDKSGGPALFGLLVIPVDFADARTPADWNRDALTGRLTAGGGESLTRYFSLASRNRLEVRVTQAPLVHLPGTRRDYSDVGYNGFTRTRALARESLEAVRDLGLEFRRLDMDGPDRVPGTADDDGQVDGVLILHAGIGQENDTVEGLVQALQFFLDEPVTSQGISATFYAVASLHSGPGIWAHETAHLLGLEDRYDPALRPAGGSEVQSLGGLGRFSLMGSGAWGSGGGYGAALPDAYSSLQMGWYDARIAGNSTGGPDTLRSGLEAGTVERVWTRGESGPEFFLLETRDPVAAYPFDANVPAGDLLIYHVDETLPEGSRAVDGPGRWHLRVSLVEADDDFKLRRGEDPGRAEDLFPGPLGKSEFAPFTVPSSNGYDGISEVSLTGITRVPGGVSFQTSVWPAADLAFKVAFTEGGGTTLDLVARSTGVPFKTLSCTVTAATSPPWGAFPGGAGSAAFDLVPDGQGSWRPDQAVSWVPDPDVPADASTGFRYDFVIDGEARTEMRTWYWRDNAGVLDFDAGWPGEWTVTTPGDNGDTFWHRWAGAGPWLTADESPVLACTGLEFSDSSAWPAVNYQNSGYAVLTSGELGPDVAAVRIIHAMEVEYLSGDEAMDGGVAAWVDPQGMEFPALPLEGRRGLISSQALNPLHGQDALIQKSLELDGDIPLWQTDIIPIPPDHPGPWRLRLSFGSNSLWRRRGWFVAGMDPIGKDGTAPGEAVFSGSWKAGSGAGLRWTWPWDGGTSVRFLVQHRAGTDSTWTEIQGGFFNRAPGGSEFFLPAAEILPYLTGPGHRRHELRVIGFIAKGPVATRPIVAFADGGDGHPVHLGLPWPNPALDSVRVMVGIPAGGRGHLGIFDLRGRRVREQSLGAGDHLFEWDGRDGHGARAPSGTYVIRLEGSGAVVMRKVVLLH